MCVCDSLNPPTNEAFILASSSRIQKIMRAVLPFSAALAEFNFTTVQTMIISTLISAVLLSTNLWSAAPVPSQMNNPLLTKSTLPFHLPPFAEIKDEHFGPAFEQGMA